MLQNRRSTVSRFPAFGALSAAVLGLLVTAPAAHAQANLVFTGGSGTPLTFTLTSPVTYTITREPGSAGPAFIFDAVGGPPIGFASASGSMLYSINNGPDRTLSVARNNFMAVDITADDLIFLGELTTLTVNDIVVLKAGSLTTTNSFAGTKPTDGAYNTFISEQMSRQISGPGISAVSTDAPEPGSLALLLPILGGVGTVVRRRRRQRRPGLH